MIIEWWHIHKSRAEFLVYHISNQIRILKGCFLKRGGNWGSQVNSSRSKGEKSKGMSFEE